MRAMKNIIFYIALFIASVGTLNAQQLEQWTQFDLNEYTVNPAVSGSDEYFHVNAMFRNQWVGITDAPRTYYLSLNGPVWNDRMGIGGSVFNDVVGPLSKAGMQLSYAYHIKLTPEYRLSFALSGSIFQWSANGAEMNLENPQDIAISNGNMSAWVPDFGFSTRFFMKNFHAGIHIPQITNSQLQLFADYAGTLSELNRHFYLNLGYRYDINDDFALDAAFFSRYVSSIFMQELNVRCTYKESVWLGTSVRMPIQQEFANAIAFMLGYQFQNNMHIGYSYDLDIGKIGQASRGSHEIMLGIRFTKNNKEPLIPHEEK
jgi:type IX secretion system PorP/SprF family membrane protein